MTIKEKIMKIMSLALEIDPPNIDDIGKKKTAVFVNWSPHCNVLDVYIYLDGWERDSNPDTNLRAYSDSDIANEELDIIIEELEGIAELEGEA